MTDGGSLVLWTGNRGAINPVLPRNLETQVTILSNISMKLKEQFNHSIPVKSLCKSDLFVHYESWCLATVRSRVTLNSPGVRT